MGFEPNRILVKCGEKKERFREYSLKVLHVVGSVDPKVGGPSVSIPRLVEFLGKMSVQAALYSFGFPFHEDSKALKNIEFYQAPRSWLSSFGGINLKGRCDFEKISKNFDLIHNHGMWIYPNSVARKVSEKLGIPLVSSLRGHLNSWELGHSKIKKKIAWNLYERNNLKAVDLFHATSEFEARMLRKQEIGRASCRERV